MLSTSSTSDKLSTREKIVNAALDLFAESGYTETTIRSIAARVGIKPASIYNHFSSKAEILNVILDEFHQLTLDQTISFEEVDTNVQVKDVRSILESMFYNFTPEDNDRHTKMLKIVHQEQFREPKAGEFVRDQMFFSNRQYIQGVLDRLVRAKKIAPIPTDIYAHIFVSVCTSASVESLFYDSFEEYRALPCATLFHTLPFLIDHILSLCTE